MSQICLLENWSIGKSYSWAMPDKWSFTLWSFEHQYKKSC